MDTIALSAATARLDALREEARRRAIVGHRPRVVRLPSLSRRGQRNGA